MPEKPKNIIEDIARDFLNSALTLRYDICTCARCRADMLTYALSKVPPEYLSAQERLSSAISDASLRRKHQAAITHAIVSAIETVSKNPKHSLNEDKTQTFKSLLNQILESRGLDFRQYHQGVIKRKLASRMRANGVESYVDYSRLLIKKPEEYEKLLEDLCINVSEFFRDPPVWVTVKCLLENIINQKKLKGDQPEGRACLPDRQGLAPNSQSHKSLKVWSAGCASGEEPYSIAILLKELTKTSRQDFSLKIYATDIDKKCLLAARNGAYLKENFKNLEDKYLKSYFIAAGDGHYQLKDEIRSLVEFQYLDLIREDFIQETDAIFCRNVFIYFNRSLQEHLLMKFYKSLKAGGYLIMGKVEMLVLEAKAIFQEIDANARIYQKKEA